ncbi:Acg family FMN-binding oxidoreductase [Labedaea rhizosphaerae]|uniref:Acg family FMN-binding oxidoreductase n=1 Tax=Labedaea rhizosphaerae TaxID=598644 RepID=UPI00105DDEB0|nr:nitroreductase [Labedaea rhizosphaerae]
MRENRAFDQQDVATIATAVGRAPSVHNTQPWHVEFAGPVVTILERTDIGLRRHDPVGRDRLISCGSALTNARLAVRRLGRAADTQAFPDHDRRDAVGRVRAGDDVPPTPAELARFRAIALRHSHRRRFGPQRPDPALVRELLEVPVADGVGLLHLSGPAMLDPLAALLSVAGQVMRGDIAYQQELDVWRDSTTSGSREGYLPAPRSERALPWAGLVDRDTAIPPKSVLRERLAAETLVLVTTVGDGRSDHVAAGVTLQEVWLECVARGLAASVLTQPLHVVDVRAGLIEQLELTGYPQVLMRLGHPRSVARSSARKVLTDIVRSPRTHG